MNTSYSCIVFLLLLYTKIFKEPCDAAYGHLTLLGDCFEHILYILSIIGTRYLLTLSIRDNP